VGTFIEFISGNVTVFFEMCVFHGSCLQTLENRVFPLIINLQLELTATNLVEQYKDVTGSLQLSHVVISSE
jgi:hypothetical protein